MHPDPPKAVVAGKYAVPGRIIAEKQGLPMTSTLVPAAPVLTLSRPDDWHVHLRDGPEMAAVVAHTARVFGRAIVMPNLKPPVTTVAAARGLSAQDHGGPSTGDRAFEPLMTLYLTDNTPPAAIAEARRRASFMR